MDDLEFVYSPDHQLALLYPTDKDSTDPGAAPAAVPSGVDADSVVVFKPFDERRAVLALPHARDSVAASADAVVAFVLAQAMPKVYRTGRSQETAAGQRCSRSGCGAAAVPRVRPS